VSDTPNRCQIINNL